MSDDYTTLRYLQPQDYGITSQKYLGTRSIPFLLPSMSGSGFFKFDGVRQTSSLPPI